MSRSPTTVLHDRAPWVREPGRDARALGRTWILACLPALALGLLQCGAGLRLAAFVGADPRATALATLGFDPGTTSAAGDFLWSLAWFLPVLAVCLFTGRFWESLFARLRGRARTEGLAVVLVLFTANLPLSIPLWKAAVGASIATVVGREIFGGLGRNPFHATVVGLLFVELAWPGALGSPTAGGLACPADNVGLAALLGAAFLVHRRWIAWQIVAGGVGGATVAAIVLGGPQSAASPGALAHVTVGSLAFNLAFVATDPVTAAATRGGRWACGIFIGFTTVLVRVANPSRGEGDLLAILLGNAVAPLFDHVAMRRSARAFGDIRVD